MNIHVDSHMREKFPNWEFRGKPFIKSGSRWFRAKHRTMGYVWYYSYELDEIFVDIPEKGSIVNEG